MSKNIVQHCSDVLEKYIANWQYIDDNKRFERLTTMYHTFFIKEEYSQGFLFKQTESLEVLKEVLHNVIKQQVNKVVIAEHEIVWNSIYGPIFTLLYGLAILDTNNRLALHHCLLDVLKKYEVFQSEHTTVLKKACDFYQVTLSKNSKGLGALLHVFGEKDNRHYQPQQGFVETVSVIQRYCQHPSNVQEFYESWEQEKSLSAYAYRYLWTNHLGRTLHASVFEDIAVSHEENAWYVSHIPAGLRYYVHLPITYATLHGVSDEDVHAALVFYWSWSRLSALDPVITWRVVEWMMMDDKNWGMNEFTTLVNQNLVTVVTRMAPFIEPSQQEHWTQFIEKYISINNALTLMSDNEPLLKQLLDSWEHLKDTWVLLQASDLGDALCFQASDAHEVTLYT